MVSNFGGIYHPEFNILGFDEHGPVFCSEERAQLINGNSKVTKEQYDEILIKADEFFREKAEEKKQAEETTEKKTFFQKIIDLFKIPEGKEQEAMDVALSQWAFDNMMF